MLINIPNQENNGNNSRLKRFILILVMTVALSGAFTPGISEDIKNSLEQPGPGLTVKHTIDLLYSRDCIASTTHSGIERSPAFEKGGATSELYCNEHDYGWVSAVPGSTDHTYYLSLLLNISAIICLLFFFHIFFIHLQDGKK